LTPLMVASRKGWLEVVRALLAAGADVNAKQTLFPLYTALVWASQDDHPEVVRDLLAAGADVNAADGRAWFVASQNGHAEVVRVFLAAGVDVPGGAAGVRQIFSLDRVHFNVLRQYIGAV
jgi:ankyrin repeat protein